MLLELSVAQLTGKEEVIARGDDAVHTGPARDTVIRMDLVMTPRVIGEHQVRLVKTDGKADLFAERHRSLELAVVVPEEHEFLHADRRAGRALLFLARLG